MGLFLGYAKHMQEVEDVVEMICNGYTGTIDLDDDFSQSDLNYIKREVKDRIGADISLD